MLIHVVTEQRKDFGGGADVEVVNDSQASPDHKNQYPVRRCRPKLAEGLAKPPSALTNPMRAECAWPGPLMTGYRIR